MSARRDKAAVEARRQRAQERLRVSQTVVTIPEPKSPKYPTPDTPEAMLAFARELGWTWVRKSSGYQFRHPSGATANMHLSISDRAAWRNLRCQLLRPVREARRTNLSPGLFKKS